MSYRSFAIPRSGEHASPKAHPVNTNQPASRQPEPALTILKRPWQRMPGAVR